MDRGWSEEGEREQGRAVSAKHGEGCQRAAESRLRTWAADSDKPVFPLGSPTSQPGNLGQAASSGQDQGYLSKGLMVSPPREVARSNSDHKCVLVSWWQR